MKGFTRNNALFSLCGLNCGLCTMRLGGHCGGCGFGNQSCSLARCALEHGAVEYCFQCGEYPCARYRQADAYDFFITSQHRIDDLEKAQKMGLERYNAEQRKRVELLNDLLSRYNDGRRKTLFCLAVNLLDLEDLTAILAEADAGTQGLPRREKAARIAALFQDCARAHGILLKLRKK